MTGTDASRNRHDFQTVSDTRPWPGRLSARGEFPYRVRRGRIGV